MSNTESLDALVLRRWDLGEADRRLSLLTSQAGKMYVLARGARKKGSRTGSATEPLMLLRCQVVRGRRNNVLAQVEVRRSFARVRQDYLRLSVALAFLESLDACLEEGDPHPESYDLAEKFLSAIEAPYDPLAWLAWADLELLDQIGFRPNWDEGGSAAALVSPMMGGVVGEGDLPPRDAFRLTRPVLEALRSLQDAAAPPAGFPSREVARALLRFWRDVAGRRLPARESLVESFANHASE